MNFTEVLQGSSQDSYTLLRTLTDGQRSYSFRTPNQMRGFIEAALAHCRTYPNDVAFVLRCLGSAETAGLSRLSEICQFPHLISVRLECSGKSSA